MKTLPDTGLTLVILFYNVLVLSISMLIATINHLRLNWLITVSHAKPHNLPWEAKPDNVRAIVGQQELGNQVNSESGEPYLHWQVFIQMRKNCSMAAIKRLLECDSAHCEPVYQRDVTKCIKYCSKDDTFVDGTRFQLGEFIKEKGNRTDLYDFVQDTLNCPKIDNDFILKHCGVLAKHDRWATRWIEYGTQMYNARWDRKNIRGQILPVPQVIVLYGPTGTGKSHSVRQCLIDGLIKDLYPVPIPSASGTRWFDYYCGDETVLFDDFRGDLKLQYLLNLTDRYPFQVPVKGGHTTWTPRRIVFTTNRNPVDWYSSTVERRGGGVVDRQGSIDALFRRFSHFIWVRKKGKGINVVLAGKTPTERISIIQKIDNSTEVTYLHEEELQLLEHPLREIWRTVIREGELEEDGTEQEEDTEERTSQEGDI